MAKCCHALLFSQQIIPTMRLSLLFLAVTFNFQNASTRDIPVLAPGLDNTSPSPGGLSPDFIDYQKRQAQTVIPNINMDYSLSGMRDNGYFYTSKDFSTSVFQWQTDSYGKWSSFINGADLYLNTSVVYQEIDYGDAVTDAGAYLLLRLKGANPQLYEETMDYLFNIRTGRRMVRAPMGASDFSLKRYTYQESQSFSISSASNITSVLTDAKQRQPDLKLVLTPWTPPAQWKSPETLNGGTFNFEDVDEYAQYFVETAKAFDAMGLRPYAFTIQNEPFHQDAYPSMVINAGQQATLGLAIRSALDSASFKDVKLLCLDHNFDLYQDAIETFNANPGTFSGGAFHAYNGSIDRMEDFRKATNNSDVFVTEMSFEVDRTSSQWTVLYYWLNVLFAPATRLFSRSVLLWNIALDQGFGPRLEDVSIEYQGPDTVVVLGHVVSYQDPPDFPSTLKRQFVLRSKAYCTDCIGSMEFTPENTYTFYPQAHVISSFSAATASLESFGGSTARQIGVEFPRRGHNQYSRWLGCLDQPLAFAATYDGRPLSNFINGTAFEKEKRIGIILANSCNSQFSLKIGVDDRSVDFVAKPGLSALTFTLNSTQTSSSLKFSIAKVPLFLPLLLSLFLAFASL